MNIIWRDWRQEEFKIKRIKELRLLQLFINYTQWLLSNQAEARASRKFFARVANSVSCKVKDYCQ